MNLALVSRYSPRLFSPLRPTMRPTEREMPAEVNLDIDVQRRSVFGSGFEVIKAGRVNKLSDLVNAYVRRLRVDLAASRSTCGREACE